MIVHVVTFTGAGAGRTELLGVAEEMNEARGIASQDFGGRPLRWTPSRADTRRLLAPTRGGLYTIHTEVVK